MLKTLGITLVIVVAITVVFSAFHPQTETPVPSPTPEQYPSANDLYQTDFGGHNHSVYIDDAIKKILRDPDSYRFISATRWTQDIAGYGANAWICQATYRAKNGFGGYALPQETGIIFDASGCRVLNVILEKKTNAMTKAERKEMDRQVKQVHEWAKGLKSDAP